MYINFCSIAFEDVDECMDAIDGCNETTSVCENTEGGFMCTCLIGFVTTSDNVCSSM